MVETIAVQVCYAAPAHISLIDVRLARGATVAQAIRQSGIIAIHPEIDISVCRVGVFGKLKALDAPIAEGDRIEIYRPLIADPMEARRRRARKAIPD